MADPHDHDEPRPDDAARDDELLLGDEPAEPEPMPAAAAVADETDEQRAEREAEERLLQLFQSTVFGEGDAKVGRVGQVYLDDQTMEPNWVTVKTGLFGTKEYFVPLDEAAVEGKQIRVPYDKETITSSPRTEIDQNLSPAEEDDLYNHYRVPGRMTTAAVDEPEPIGAPAPAPLLDDEPAPADAPVAEAEPVAAEPVAEAEPVFDEEPAAPADDDAPAPGRFEGFDEAEPLDDSAFAPPAERDDEAPKH